MYGMYVAYVVYWYVSAAPSGRKGYGWGFALPYSIHWTMTCPSPRMSISSAAYWPTYMADLSLFTTNGKLRIPISQAPRGTSQSQRLWPEKHRRPWKKRRRRNRREVCVIFQVKGHRRGAGWCSGSQPEGTGFHPRCPRPIRRRRP